MKKLMIDGNEAVARVSYLFTELASIYPITPSSPMAEHVEAFASQNMKNLFDTEAHVVEMQSEAGAAGVLHGALQAGTLGVTYTASQGLLLMIPNMYKIAGEMLPCVMHVAARSLSTHALSILGDHQDVYATRMTGFAMLSSSNPEEAGDMAAVSHLAAIEAGMPFLHFFDGFRTSHELSTVTLLERDDLAPLLNKKKVEKFRTHSLLGETPYTIGTNQNDDIYFQATEARNQAYDAIPDIVNDYMTKINRIKGTHYQPFEYYGSSVAEHIIVAMGSVTETIKETIDVLNEQGYQVGLIIVHLYRPFSPKYLLQVLPTTVQRIAVLDRTKESGSVGEPLYLDIKSVLGDNISVYGGRYGLSSKNTTPSDIKAVYDFLRKQPFHNFTVGIIDDVTHLSLPVDHHFYISSSHEMRIYGYGSDGMISASKSLLKLIGTSKNQYIQGYFQYDSKKSGGVTISHLRISEHPIRSTYYVEHPRIVVISKDTYLDDFDCFHGICKNGIVLINTAKTEEELNHLLTPKDKQLLRDQNITCYTIHAYALARKLGLKDKISMIMESAILSLLEDFSHEEMKQELIQYIQHHFYKKGHKVVEANIQALDQALSYITRINIYDTDDAEILDLANKSVINALQNRTANLLPTSAFLKGADGKFYYDEKETMKRGISALVPEWISSNCIQCNQCSFVCPHSVIRPFLLTEAEYQEAPDIVKQRAIKAKTPDLSDYYYLLAVSIQNCTGCGLCIKTCPAIPKALTEISLDDSKRNHEQEIFDYVNQHVTEKPVGNKYTIKGSQFRKPKFEFCGACAGCGEPAYIKLLTQLFGEQLVIANATGCSSIYGASVPTLPYQVSWGSSLFEDNAEYGYGILLSEQLKQERMRALIAKYQREYPIFETWLEQHHDLDQVKELYHTLSTMKLPSELENYRSDFLTKTVWCIGGDGWAYDIGYSGIDHVLSRSDNINILVLDTEVYSNTGGQSSKASPKGTIASFTSNGKKLAKKDLAAIALMYPHVYVAQVSLGGNMQQVIRVMREAANYDGPSIIIAYAPCIAHGLIGGMQESIASEKLAVTCGYFPIFHRHPETGKFLLDYKNVDFDQYENYLRSQLRYQMLETVNPDHAKELFEQNKQDAMRRFQSYQELASKKDC